MILQYTNKSVQYRRVVSGHSEPCLKSVGHMTNELLKFKNVNKSFKIVRDVNQQQQKVCAMCVYAIELATTNFESVSGLLNLTNLICHYVDGP